MLHRESSLKRVKHCGRYATGDSVAVRVTTTADGRRAGLGGVQSCGSVWACPVCSEKVNAGRQGELSRGIERWQKTGGAVLFGTLTLRHNRGHRLADLWDAIGPSWNRTTSGAGAQWKADKSRFGIAGYVRVVETKHGQHGWHPHVHFLLFLDAPLEGRQVADLSARMFGRWEAALATHGLSVLQSVGIDLRPVQAGEALADYFTKGTYATATGAAYEVTGSHSKKAGKGGRSPFDLLRDVVGLGDADALDLWHEWEKASKGRRQLTWSRGLRARLLEDEEKSDQELVDEDAGGETEAVVCKKGWRWIAADPGRPCQVLEAVESDASGWKIHRLLVGWGFHVLGDGADEDVSHSRRYVFAGD